jgi:hypothetical protein
MVVWRAQTPAVGSGAAAASDTAIGGTRGEVASAARQRLRTALLRRRGSDRTVGSLNGTTRMRGSHVEMAR